MSAPTVDPQPDVLAVIEEAANWEGYRLDYRKRDKLRAAADAMAEVIRALGEMTALAEGPTGGVTADMKRAVIAKARAALVGVGGRP